MSDKNIPRVEIIAAIKPTNAGTGQEVLEYEELEPAVDKYSQSHAERLAAAWQSKDGSLEELYTVRQVAAEYLIRTADKLVHSDSSNRDLWADRFTQASGEIYGTPDTAEVTKMVREEYEGLLQLRGSPEVSQPHLEFLLNTYEPLVDKESGNPVDRTERQQETDAIQQYGRALIKKYGALFELVDAAGLEQFGPEDLFSVFTKTLAWLETNEDPVWREWVVEMKDSTILSIHGSKHKIIIPSRRDPVSALETKGLIAHEVVVHALKAKNGQKHPDEHVQIGLPDRLVSEEGLGMLVEQAITGKLPDKAYDRYIDIALALGTVDGRQRTRNELFQISYARQLVRAQQAGADAATLRTLPTRVWTHIDRIYRGGPGDDVGTRQAIFTKDITYYMGYKHMVTYLVEQLASGKTASEILQFLSQARFDPTNPAHLKRLEQK